MEGWPYLCQSERCDSGEAHLAGRRVRKMFVHGTHGLELVMQICLFDVLERIADPRVVHGGQHQAASEEGRVSKGQPHAVGRAT